MKTPTPKAGDVFRISNKRLFTYGTVTKTGRVNFFYESLYHVGNVRQLMKLKCPLSEWADAEVSL